MISYVRRILKPRILLSCAGAILSIALIAGWFYWFQWRPAQIRKDCLAQISKTSGEAGSVSAFNNYFRVCLARKGLKAEDLLKTSE